MYHKHIYCSDACAINLGSSVLITGGYYYTTSNTVSEYNEAGWLRDLRPLLQRRRGHGCSYFNNEEGTKVDIDINNCPIITNDISDLPRGWWLRV